jgi:hypothetical protein
LLAAGFHQAIQRAHEQGKIKPTTGGFTVSTGPCTKHAGSGIDAGGLTQRGSGADDDIYYHDSVELQVCSDDGSLEGHADRQIGPMDDCLGLGQEPMAVRSLD